MKIHQHYNLSNANTLKLRSSCRYFIELESEQDVLELLTLKEFDFNNFFVLGEGSNVILPEIYGGCVLKVVFQEFNLQSEKEGKFFNLKVGAGQSWASFIDYCLDNELCGLENLTLIPGSVGAAPIQNIGAYGVEVCDSIKSVQVFNFKANKFEILSREQCLFSYRNSLFKQNPNQYLILSVEFSLAKKSRLKADYQSLKVRLKEDGISDSMLSARLLSETISKIRQERLPNPEQFPNVGSFFKNPIVSLKQFTVLKDKFPKLVYFDQEGDFKKLSAAWLIDNANWKGRTEGNLFVSEQHALVLVNKGCALQEDVLVFAQKIQKDIFDRFSVVLEIEPVVKS
jgi:UDP-N-acetylmuramate dehydrogenase